MGVDDRLAGRVRRGARDVPARDLDSYLLEATGRNLGSVWRKKAHATESFIGVGQAVFCLPADAIYVFDVVISASWRSPRSGRRSPTRFRVRRRGR